MAANNGENSPCSPHTAALALLSSDSDGSSSLPADSACREGEHGALGSDDGALNDIGDKDDILDAASKHKKKKQKKSKGNHGGMLSFADEVSGDRGRLVFFSPLSLSGSCLLC